MVVVAGPTGCGRTTALYACMNHVASPERNVMSIENPVEFMLPWVVQLQVLPRSGFTFAAAMRSILRSDPDVIMVGSLNDQEMLMMAQQAALTGHVVLSALDADDAVQALRRMRMFG